MEVLVILIGLLFALGIAIAAAALASRKNRNPVNWFFVSCFWGIIGLIVLACSEKLNKEEYEKRRPRQQATGIHPLFRR